MENLNRFGAPTEEELKKINELALKELTADEVFVFTVTLCDNEIDRDFECFDIDALSALSPLFVGKSGIYDHSMKAKDQSCRSFETYLEKPEGKFTSYGEPYCRLMARAYCLNTPENRELISQIEGGIKKEVSVSCSVSEQRCSICGKNLKTELCEHKKGRFYRKNGQKMLCYNTLKNPTDAYEWSFVAVPAQRNAGVTKSLFELDEMMKSQHQTVIDKGCYGEISQKLAFLSQRAKIADEYEQSLRDEIAAYSAAALDDVSAATLKRLSLEMNVEELKGLCAQLKAQHTFSGKPQLFKKSCHNTDTIEKYKI